MFSLFQISSEIWHISIVLGLAIIVATNAALKMVEKKKINIFIPFFVLGLGLCLTAGFMFYEFFGVALDIFDVFTFVLVAGIFFILWRVKR
jgi:hypothetical protein